MLQRKFQITIKKKRCAKQKARSDNKVTKIAGCFCMLKEPDDICVSSKQIKSRLKKFLSLTTVVQQLGRINVSSDLQMRKMRYLEVRQTRLQAQQTK